jgi:hypothetical protein
MGGDGCSVLMHTRPDRPERKHAGRGQHRQDDALLELVQRVWAGCCDGSGVTECAAGNASVVVAYRMAAPRQDSFHTVGALCGLGCWFRLFLLFLLLLAVLLAAAHGVCHACPACTF